MTASIALFTRDLRLADNPVLDAARRSADTVVPLFVIDDGIVPDRCPPNRAAFLASALAELDAGLREIGGHLVVRRGDVATEVARVVAETGAESVHVAQDVSAFAARREEALRAALSNSASSSRETPCAVHPHSAVITAVDPSALAPATGRDYYAVFTPYFRRWVDTHRRRPLGRPHHLAVPDVASATLPSGTDLAPGKPSPNCPTGGERTGRALLRKWLAGPIDDYAERNDDLAADATSHLSPYLHFGCLSPVEVVHRTDLSTDGGHAFARQLAWRDFHHQLLAARPDTAATSLRPGPFPVRRDPQAVTAWQEGRTGYPIIDAAMRQLVTDGWMPGRARLLTASFFTKSLRLDWRIGAAHFLHWLVDADLANNQLNWQWAAGTGTDTRPNRVLNPLRQADRHDPDGAYVRRHLPELAHLPGASIHRPWRADVPHSTYPPPLLDVAGM
ncbi:cryptochrome/photolyase family protein [Nocardia caishijiensis]|uniref:Deoxyribodipyrimidine photo-lyase n=1 Tax=Nocardia caishijiensis TaxID=184756 RepID=A0ABQ6YFZ9_9NOCA|nr:deoxyribodipyrimidine photo-lyase [Nocardia caishijiensis]KAF0842548.1 deoxyribodipyrimidine photo-lyase [Nocardia caishijiensis]